MPAPSASLVNAPADSLLLTVVLATVRVPQLSIPPPPACANRQSWIPQEKPASTEVVGAAVLPVMTLFEIVTVAPVAKFAAGGTKMPPPSAITPSSPTSAVDTGLDPVTPLVTVTPRIATVGSVVAPNIPTVITGPPPLIIVL